MFGASDEVLGAVESGVDFEKRIAAIYQKCRSPEQIEFEFDQLQKELETDIAEGQQDAREKLLNNFDQEVIEKVRVQSHNVLDRFNRLLWLMTRHVLADCASFQEPDYSFMLHKNPFSAETIHPGPYGIGKKIEDVNTYRVGHPLAQRVLDRAKAASTPVSELTFHLTGSGKNVAILVPKAKFSNADNDTRGPWMSRSLLGLCDESPETKSALPYHGPHDRACILSPGGYGLEVCQRTYAGTNRLWVYSVSCEAGWQAARKEIPSRFTNRIRCLSKHNR